jgi:hypothetical protein
MQEWGTQWLQPTSEGEDRDSRFVQAIGNVTACLQIKTEIAWGMDRMALTLTLTSNQNHRKLPSLAQIESDL